MRCVSQNDTNDCVVYLTAWVDKKPVYMVTSMLPYAVNVRRKAYNTRREYEVIAPSVITIYNKNMDGTDKIDQTLSYYRIKTTTKRWQCKRFVYFLFVALANAHILFKADLPDSSEVPARRQRGYYFIDFLMMIIKDLVPDELYARATAPPRVTPTPTPYTPVPRTIVPTPMQNTRAAIQTPAGAVQNAGAKLSGFALNVIFPYV